MGTKDVRWEKYPAIVPADRAGRWLDMQANLGLAPNTMDAYGRALDDYIRFSTAASVDVATAGREHVARWVRDLCERPNAAAAGARQSGLSNATIQQRLTAVRLFYDHLVSEAVRDQNPVRAHTAATRVGRATTAETSSERSQGKSHRRVVSIWRSRCVKTRALVPRQARVWLGMLLTTHIGKVEHIVQHLMTMMQATIIRSP
jgi:Phage integrase, N-terminal SAM-like domain